MNRRPINEVTLRHNLVLAFLRLLAIRSTKCNSSPP
jgi:hypothetical protein